MAGLAHLRSHPINFNRKRFTEKLFLNSLKIVLGDAISFREEVADLAKRAISAQAIAQTEEATKNAIVMPFLRVLGLRLNHSQYATAAASMTADR